MNGFGPIQGFSDCILSCGLVRSRYNSSVAGSIPPRTSAPVVSSNSSPSGPQANPSTSSASTSSGQTGAQTSAPFGPTPTALHGSQLGSSGLTRNKRSRALAASGPVLPYQPRPSHGVPTSRRPQTASGQAPPGAVGTPQLGVLPLPVAAPSAWPQPALSPEHKQIFCHWYGLKLPSKRQYTQHASEFMHLRNTFSVGAWLGGPVQNYEDYRDFSLALKNEWLGRLRRGQVEIIPQLVGIMPPPTHPIGDLHYKEIAEAGIVKKHYFYDSDHNLMLIVDAQTQFITFFRRGMMYPTVDLYNLAPHKEGFDDFYSKTD